MAVREFFEFIIILGSKLVLTNCINQRICQMYN